MAANSFGTVFRITTWGESHGKAIGVVIDGCPAGLDIEESEINSALQLRAPGKNSYVSPRSERDQVQILSGVFQGKTTGTPISLLILNEDVDSSQYEPTKKLLKPGHANATYLEKYGVFDYRGGGRASARETACRVAAGAIAKKLLFYFGIELVAYVKQIGPIAANVEDLDDLEKMRSLINSSPLFCPDPCAAKQMMALIASSTSSGDSLGGVVEFLAVGSLVGLGDPVYEKLEANLAHAMLSIPATKGFEIGSGFKSVIMAGSEHNDAFALQEGKVRTKTNHAGGILGGIGNGMPLFGAVAFKPTSSIRKTQETLDISGENALFQQPNGSRHDPCVAIRAVPVVEAMLALVLVDAYLLNRCAHI